MKFKFQFHRDNLSQDVMEVEEIGCGYQASFISAQAGHRPQKTEISIMKMFQTWYDRSMQVMAFRNPLDVETNKAVRLIMQEVKSYAASRQTSDKVIRIDSSIAKMIEITLAKTPGKMPGPPMVIDPLCENGVVKMDIYVCRNLVDLEEFYMDLADAVRHELEHASQHATGRRRSTGFEHNYETKPAEIDAYIRGIMLVSKKKGIPFADELKKFLLDIVIRAARDASRSVFGAIPFQSIRLYFNLEKVKEDYRRQKRIKVKQDIKAFLIGALHLFNKYFLIYRARAVELYPYLQDRIPIYPFGRTGRQLERSVLVLLES